MADIHTKAKLSVLSRLSKFISDEMGDGLKSHATTPGEQMAEAVPDSEPDQDGDESDETAEVSANGKADAAKLKAVAGGDSNKPDFELAAKKKKAVQR